MSGPEVYAMMFVREVGPHPLYPLPMHTFYADIPNIKCMIEIKIAEMGSDPVYTKYRHYSDTPQDMQTAPPVLPLKVTYETITF